jgi:hypothetical protein
MNHVYKFCSVTLLPMFYSLRERVRAQMAEPSFAVDLMLLAFFVIVAVYLWSRCIKHVQEISLQLLFVLLGVALAMVSSHFGLTMWELMATKYPGWHSGAWTWVISNFYIGRMTIDYWMQGSNNLTAPIE